MESVNIAVITGASSGLGRGLAFILSRKGYKLILIGRNEQRLLEVAEECMRYSTVECFSFDILDTSARSVILQKLEQEKTKNILIVHNAAIMNAGEFLDTSLVDIRYAFNVNFLAPVEFTRDLCALSHPPREIMFILSNAACYPQPYNAVYSATKAGLRFFVDSLRVEMAGKMRICQVYPPLMDTPMITNFASSTWKLKKADPLRVAERIISLFESGRDYISWFDLESLPAYFYRWMPALFFYFQWKYRLKIRSLVYKK